MFDLIHNAIPHWWYLYKHSAATFFLSTMFGVAFLMLLVAGLAEIYETSEDWRRQHKNARAYKKRKKERALELKKSPSIYMELPYETARDLCDSLATYLVWRKHRDYGTVSIRIDREYEVQ